MFGYLKKSKGDQFDRNNESAAHATIEAAYMPDDIWRLLIFHGWCSSEGNPGSVYLG
jgi:hypothetical protein